ncbi:MAG: hypothetical protein ABI162_11750, partial [Luteolibacter sp.]
CFRFAFGFLSLITLDMMVSASSYGLGDGGKSPAGNFGFHLNIAQNHESATGNLQEPLMHK